MTEIMDTRCRRKTLIELKQIVITRREDVMKDHNTVHRALYHYNRLGDNAYFRRVLINTEIKEFTKQDLLAVITELLNYEQTISYTGLITKEEITTIIEEYYELPKHLKKPQDYRHLPYREPNETQIYFVNREMAQSLVRVEFGGVLITKR